MLRNRRSILRVAGATLAAVVMGLAAVGVPTGAQAGQPVGGGGADVAAAKPKPRLTITNTSPAIIDAGERVWLAGRATPGLEQRSVVLQQKVGSAWKNVGRSRVKGDGSFRVGGTASRGGFEIPYRVKAPRSGTKAAVTSPTSPITVYAWYALTALTPVASPEVNARSVNFEKVASVSVDGKAYGSSWASRYYADGFDDFESGQGTFVTGTGCTSLEATVGVNDAAGANTSWQFLVYLDGNETNYGFKTKGQAEKLTIDVTAVNRVRLVNSRLAGPLGDGSYRGDAVWAGGRIKCAGRP